MSDRVEPVARRRGPAPTLPVAPVRDEQRHGAPDPDARRRPRRPRPAAPAGITRDADGRPHVDLEA